MKQQKASYRIICYCLMALFLVFIAATVVSGLIRTTVKASDLQERKQENGDTVRIDYVDDSGQITFATDKGYATRIETRDGTQSVFTFLDEDGQPVALAAGYDEVHRIYAGNGKAGTDTFFLNGEQVARKQGFYQYARSYGADGKLCEVRYLDQQGNLVDTTAGYAGFIRKYGENSRTDMYYDAEGKPATASLGQSGKKMEKKDDAVITTYLDADGNPVNTTKGFAIVKKEGSKTLYYDCDGNPVTVGRGQYGVEKDEDGQDVYLDEEGEQMFRLDNFLNNHPLLVLLIGMAVTVIAALLKGKWRIAFLVAYLIFIGVMTIAFRETGNSHTRFELFYAFRRFFDSATVRQNFMNNIWLFVPLGTCLASFRKKWLWLVPVGVSVVIEATQYFTGIGLCDLDDVLSNSLGGFIGYGFCVGLRWMREGNGKHLDDDGMDDDAAEHLTE